MKYKLVVFLAMAVVLASLAGCVYERDHWWNHHPRHDDRPEIVVKIK